MPRERYALVGKLILVRHGKTLLNALDDSERLRGWLDVPLDPQGLQEAITTAKCVAQYSIDAIYTSDLCRAQQTAAALVQETKVPLFHTYVLRPWNVGDLAGQRVADILPALKRLELNPDMPAPGGESFSQFYARFSGEIANLLDAAARSRNCIVAVTHVRNLLATPTIVTGGDKTRIPVTGGPKTGSLLWVERRRGRWRIRLEQPPAAAEQLAGCSPALGDDFLETAAD